MKTFHAEGEENIHHVSGVFTRIYDVYDVLLLIHHALTGNA